MCNVWTIIYVGVITVVMINDPLINPIVVIYNAIISLDKPGAIWANTSLKESKPGCLAVKEIASLHLMEVHVYL